MCTTARPLSTVLGAASVRSPDSGRLGRGPRAREQLWTEDDYREQRPSGGTSTRVGAKFGESFAVTSYRSR